jgi:hypothetical protein
MSDPPTEKELDLSIQVSEARTDSKFAELLGEMKVIGARLDAIERATSGIKATVIGTAVVAGIGIIGVLIAILGYGQQWLGVGLNITEVSEKAATAAVQRYATEHAPPVPAHPQAPAAPH